MNTSTSKSGPHLRSIPSATKPEVRAPKASRSLGVVDQVQQALKPRNRLATAIGFLLGGFVPLATFAVAHYEVDAAVALYSQMAAYLVLGGLVYSAKTVFSWGERAFASGAKAAGFVLLLEGVMVTSHMQWLAMTALAYLICINGVATGCTLSLDRAKK